MFWGGGTTPSSDLTPSAPWALDLRCLFQIDWIPALVKSKIRHWRLCSLPQLEFHSTCLLTRPTISWLCRTRTEILFCHERTKSAVSRYLGSSIWYFCEGKRDRDLQELRV